MAAPELEVRTVGTVAKAVGYRGLRHGNWELWRILSYLVVPLSLFVGWTLIVSYGWVNSYLIPAPSEIADSLWSWFFGSVRGDAGVSVVFAGTGWESVWATMQRVIQGFGISCAVAIPLGIAIGYWPLAARLFDPTLQFFRPVPVTAWIPFAIVVFGIRDASATSLVFLAAFFPLLLNTTAGVRSVPQNYIRAGLMLGARRHQILLHIVLRAALPSILTGMRLGLGFAWMSCIVAEMLAVKSGIGYVLWNSYNLLRMGFLGAAMLTIGSLGFTTDLLTRLLTRRLVGWSETRR